MSGKLAEDFAAFKIVEEEQSTRLQVTLRYSYRPKPRRNTERLQNLSCQIRDLVGKYDDAVRDLESERVARRFTQQDADESRAKYEELQQYMVRLNCFHISRDLTSSRSVVHSF